MHFKNKNIQLSNFLKIFFFLFLPLAAFCQSNDTIFLKTVDIIELRNLNETGTKIQKIDSIIISQKQINNLSELLDENSSLYIKTAGRGQSATLTIRGTSASHSKVTWNGINLNSPITGAADLSQIPNSITDNLEILYGASSLSKNENTLGGLINMRSTTDWKKGLRLQYSTLFGSFYSFDNLLNIKAGNAKFQSATKVYENYSKNNFKFFNRDIANGHIQRRANADYLRYGIEQEFYYRINTHNLLSLSAWYQGTKRGIPGLSTNESGYNSKINRDSSNNFVYSANYMYVRNNFKLNLIHGGNFSDNYYKSTNNINNLQFVFLNSNSKYSVLTNSLSIEYKINHKLLLKSNLFYIYQKISAIEYQRHEGCDTLRNEGGLSLSLYYKIFAGFQCGIVLKQDLYDRKFSPFIPAFFLEYSYKSFCVKSSVSRSYNKPSLSDLYFFPGGNQNLKPEKGIACELGFVYKIDLKSASLEQELNFNYNNISDWIMWKPTPFGYWTPLNLDKVICYGGEYSAKINFKIRKINFKISGIYSFTKSENHTIPNTPNDQSYRKQLPFIPIHSASGFIYSEYRKYFLLLKSNFYSTRFTTTDASSTTLNTIKPLFLTNISLGKTIYYKDFQFDISFNINNLFNSKYYSVLMQPMPGINFSGNLVVKFR